MDDAVRAALINAHVQLARTATAGFGAQNARYAFLGDLPPFGLDAFNRIGKTLLEAITGLMPEEETEDVESKPAPLWKCEACQDGDLIEWGTTCGACGQTAIPF